MLVLSKIDLQAIGKEIGVRLGHDISPAILPWIRNTKAELAERNRELDDAVELLEALGQQQMDDYKRHKAEVEAREREIKDLKSLRQEEAEYFAGRLNSLVAALSARNSELAETKAELELAETVHATVSDELALYRKAVGPVKECVAMEESGIVIPSKVVEAFRDCIRILGGG
jgi:DNA repair exonuclease SbcCD ATPase subunit